MAIKHQRLITVNLLIAGTTRGPHLLLQNADKRRLQQGSAAEQSGRPGPIAQTINNVSLSSLARAVARSTQGAENCHEESDTILSECWPYIITCEGEKGDAYGRHFPSLPVAM